MRSFITSFLLFSAGFAYSMGHKSPVVVPSPVPVASPMPAPSGFVPKVSFEPVEYYTTDAERAKIAAAGLKAAEVIQGDCLFQFLSHRALIQTGGQSPLEVATRVQNLTGVVPVEMYYRPMWLTSAVAYRNVGENTIHLNRAWFTTARSDCEWAATLGHESYGHSLGGYDHDFKWSPSRSFSVPYSIGGADKAQGGSAFDRCCQ